MVRLKQYPDERPRARGGCADMPRPCPFVSCKWHLAHEALDVDVPVDVVAEAIANADDTCTLDVADRGPANEREVAEVLSVTYQRVQQLSRRGLIQASHAAGDEELETLRSLVPPVDPLFWAHSESERWGEEK